jgi:hypothetical protein
MSRVVRVGVAEKGQVRLTDLLLRCGRKTNQVQRSVALPGSAENAIRLQQQLARTRSPDSVQSLSEKNHRLRPRTTPVAWVVLRVRIYLGQLGKQE